VESRHLRQKVDIPGVFLYGDTIDSQKQINGLPATVGLELGHNQFSGFLMRRQYAISVNCSKAMRLARVVDVLLKQSQDFYCTWSKCNHLG
jgi:hypothetical protein